jgi:hypothetical protein
MIGRSLAAVALFAAVIAASCARAPIDCGNAAADRKAADCAAWLIFAQINQRAAAGSPFAQWETWGEAKDVFNPSGPVWPKKLDPEKHLRPLRQLENLPDKLALPNSEARVNPATFEFVRDNGYWNVDGLRKIRREGVDFPKTSIEVKAVWEDVASIPENQRDRFHWQKSASTHQPIRLTGLHMTSKILPNWLWATWIHESDTYPTNDRFGYPDGKLSKDLEKVLRHYNVPREWWHYRLVGTQTDFVSSTGAPLKLGNPQIEGNEAAESSCMTCHAMARVDDGANIYRGGRCCCCTGCGLVGAPVENSFLNKTQLDFVWSFVEIRSSGVDRCPDPAHQCP